MRRLTNSQKCFRILANMLLYLLLAPTFGSCFLGGAGIIVCCSVVLFLHRREWAMIFTKDPEVVEAILEVMPFQNSFLVLDAIQGGNSRKSVVFVLCSH
jgi:Na+-driven multidrug efflux pump